MKKAFFALIVLFGISSAFISKNDNYKVTRPNYEQVTLYRPSNCQSITCDATATNFVCTDLKEINCEGNFYSGSLKRDNF